jgi:hypothetical protein
MARARHRETKFTGTAPAAAESDADESQAPLFGHCDRKTCRDTRKAEACGCRPCVECDPKNRAILEAGVLEHCGSVTCMARIRPETKAIYPSCACPCETCAHIANVAGLARPDGTRGGLRPPSQASAPSSALEDPAPEDWVAWEKEAGAIAAALHDPDELADPVLEPLEDIPDPVLEEDLDDLELADPVGEPVIGEPASPTNRLGALDERALPSVPVVTGSKCSLLRECVYWTRTDVERLQDETSEEAVFGTAGHLYAEEYAKGKVTPAREDEILEMVPRERREKLRLCFVHVQRWLDAHRGAFRNAEVAVAWDPDAGELGRGVPLGPALEEMFVEGHRTYSNARVWAALRERLELGPRSIPATIDLVNLVHGEWCIYDWCFGRTDKRRQLALGCLAMANIYPPNGGSVAGFGLYVDAEEGVREHRYTFLADDLAKQAAEFRDLLTAAPSSAPTPGLHCTHDYCPARAMCPVTQSSAAMVVDPAAPAELVNGVEFRFSRIIGGRAHARWLLPRVRLVKDAAEKVKEALEAWAGAQAEPWIETSDGEALQEITVKGRESFNVKHAEALLRTLGATEEQIGDCYRRAPSHKEWRNKKLPAGASR